VGAVLRAVFALRVSGLEGRQVSEHLVRSLEALAVSGREERDLVIALSSCRGATCFAMKSMPSSVSRWRTADEYGHHSAW
jgi:hypothetical protein